MSADWHTATFDQFCDITRGASPRPIHDYLSKEGVPWIKIADATAETSRFITATKERIKKEGVKASVEVFPGDLILSNSATPGLPKFLKIHACIHDGWMLLRNFRNLDKEFAYWLLLRERTNLVAQGNGSVFTNLKTEILKRHTVSVPPLLVQKKIAQTLNAIDDRITLLRETNQTLEAIAQAIFESWFVDFDPVRAKSQGLEPEGMDAETAAMFPDAFVDSELGEIPEGWSTSKIGAELNAVLGGTPSRSRKEYWLNGSIPWINSGKVNEFRITTPSELITAEAMKKSSTKLLPARTTVLAITGATLGQISITEIAVCANQSVVGLLSSDKFSTEFIYFWINANIQKLIANQTGGAQQHINKGNVEDLLILSPSSEILNRFSGIAEPLFRKIAENCFQVGTLTHLRDAVLPRLISGQLQIPDAEQAIEKATV